MHEIITIFGLENTGIFRAVALENHAIFIDSLEDYNQIFDIEAEV